MGGVVEWGGGRGGLCCLQNFSPVWGGGWPKLR